MRLNWFDIVDDDSFENYKISRLVIKHFVRSSSFCDDIMCNVIFLVLNSCHKTQAKRENEVKQYYTSSLDPV